MIDAHCHSSSILVQADAARAFQLMADGLRQGRWTFGSWNRRQIGPHLFVGESLFSGAAAYVRIRADEAALTIDYDVGASETQMRLRNAARVFDGPTFGHPPGTALITLWSWRLASQSDDAWAQLCSTHETEMFLIRGLLETGRDEPLPQPGDAGNA